VGLAAAVSISASLSKAELLLLKLIHLFAREVLLVQKLEIKETKTTKYSTFKTDIKKVGLVFSIYNLFINKTSLANKWMRKKIPSCSNSALACPHFYNVEIAKVPIIHDSA
jgi:ABC-type polar amino acid transport system ATPase subunit